MKRIMFAATTSGTGKTTISSGVMRAFTKRGYKVQPFKVGPDYIDTEYHSIASGNKSRNLDEFMLPEEEIKFLFNRASKSADISIIEGVMGLYDGLGSGFDYCSSSSMSKIIDCPVILIIDGKSMAASAAALVLGFKNLDPKVRIAGVIANNVSTKSHFDIIKKSVEENTQIPVIGRIPKDPEFSLSSRHLGLTPSVEVDDLDKKMDYIAQVIEENINLDLLLEIAETGPVAYDETRRMNVKDITDLRLALAFDKAFNFYYKDSLELLEEMGVKLVEFSPLKDKKLPENIQGIFLGGGFPEVFAKQLSENKEMLEQIKSLADDGIPLYAECGGLMYLGESLQDLEGNELKMTGIFDGKSQMGKKLQRFGYCQGTAEDDSVISEKGSMVRGHEFHYSDFESDEEAIYQMNKNLTDGTVKSWRGGYKKNNVLGTYLHTHFAGDYNLALHFISKMEEYKYNKNSKNNK